MIWSQTRPKKLESEVRSKKQTRLIGTSATLCVGSLYVFFPWKISNSATKFENAITLKWLKVETRNLYLSWGTYESFFVQIFGAISFVIRVSKPKTETPIGGLNSSSSKTNRSMGIKLLNLVASGHAVSALKINYDNSDNFFGLPRRLASKVLMFFSWKITNS